MLSARESPVDQTTPAPLAIVQAWQDAANTQDTARMQALSAPDIEVVGPRGSGFGRQLLAEWLGRAGLTLTPLRAFLRDNVVVVEQRGVWRDIDRGRVTGDKVLASAFQVDDQGQVSRFARFDTLREALDAAGLTERDEVR